METNVAAIINSPPLNPELFKPSIEAIDEDVFTSGVFDDARRKSLAGHIRTLAGELDARKDEPASVHFAKELQTLAVMTERLRADVAVERSPLPNQWMRIRASVFDDAAWFARSEADLHQPPPPPNPMLVSRTVVESFGRTLDELVRLAGELPDKLAAVTPDGAPAFKESWQQGIESVRASIPPDPAFPRNPFLAHAIQNAREAARVLARLPELTRPWAGIERQRWTEVYARAGELAAEARKDLTDIETKED